MSVRVLRTKPGEQYNHGFMDDLESFFWLLVWSVAAHLDPEEPATDEALHTLHSLDSGYLGIMKSFKSDIFTDCSNDDGSAILTRVESFGNSWATNDGILLLIFTMGNYFHSKVYSNNDSIHEPSSIFPEIIALIVNAPGFVE